jgi:hypothetical protein
LSMCMKMMPTRRHRQCRRRRRSTDRRQHDKRGAVQRCAAFLLAHPLAQALAGVFVPFP